jgi:hypothetical protein
MAGAEGSTDQVVSFVRGLIDRGRLRADAARRAMNEHLLQAARYQAQEHLAHAAAAKPEPRASRRRTR